MPQVKGVFMSTSAEKLNSDMEKYFASKQGKAALAQTISGYNGIKVTGEKAFMQACMKTGPFDAFESLDPVLRALAANKQLQSITQWVNDAKTPEELSQRLIDEGFLYNPAMRLGIALAYDQKENFAGKDPDFFRKVDGALSQKVFEDTLAPMIDDERIAYTSESPDKDAAVENIRRHEESQKVMLKMLYAAQMGESFIYDDAGKAAPWPTNVSEMFMSGQRTGFILPAVTETNRDARTLGKREPDATSKQEAAALREQLVTSIYGDNRGLAAGNKMRTAATHAVKLQSFSLKEKFKEIKVGIKTGLHKLFGGQFGMDIAAGGLGKKGPGGRFENDGTCGHMYSHINSGDSKHHGALLVGFESDAPGKTNRLGHTHGASATPEFASCFGTQKDNTVGKKYGGREVDLSKVDAKTFIEDMKKFDAFITNRQRRLLHPDEAVRKQAADELSEIGKKLAGGVMPRNEFGAFKNTINAMSRQDVAVTVQNGGGPEKKEVVPESLGKQAQTQRKQVAEKNFEDKAPKRTPPKPPAPKKK